MYSTNGVNYVHVYYSPTNNIVLNINGVETTCSVPQLSHNNFNKIIIGKSCNGATCTLSCASNGVVNAFTNNNAVMTLSGISTVNFGGYASGTTNLFGAIQRARIVKGSIANTVFLDLSKNKLQGAWYFRDGTGSNCCALCPCNQNKKIRDFVNNQSPNAFCKNHQCIFYDFGDMEDYDPDNINYIQRFVTDGLDYSAGS
jgi:hypothetical protein